MVKVGVAIAATVVMALYPLAGVKAIIFEADSPAVPVGDNGQTAMSSEPQVQSQEAGSDGAVVPLSPAGEVLLTRGEVVAKVVSYFELEAKQKDFLADCIAHADECFFVFSTMSHFDGIQFFPLILYPDVSPAYEYYDEIMTASMLGLVHGYLEEDTSPFHPDAGITRIQALKVVLGAVDAIKWKEKFELQMEADQSALAGVPAEDFSVPYTDVDPSNECMWWYGRYLRFALDNGIVDPGETFRPDEMITEAELNDMMARAKDFMGADAEPSSGNEPSPANESQPINNESQEVAPAKQPVDSESPEVAKVLQGDYPGF